MREEYDFSRAERFNKRLDALQQICDLKVQHEKEHTLNFLVRQSELMRERYREGTAERCLEAKAEAVLQMAEAIRENQHRPNDGSKPAAGD